MKLKRRNRLLSSLMPGMLAAMVIFLIAFQEPPGKAPGLVQIYGSVKNAVLPLCRSDTREIVATGFVISPEGHILTVDHYAGQVSEPFHCAVVPEPGTDAVKVVPLRLISRDPEHDLALLKLEDPALVSGWIPAAGDSESVSPGNEVSFYGYPHARELTIAAPTIHAGIVSSIKSAADKQHLQHFPRLLQINATGEKGFSGAPLVLNSNSRVVGVMAAYFHSDNQIAFAIPIEYARKLITGNVKT